MHFKHIATTVIAGALAISPSVAFAAAPCPVITKTIAFGSRGAEVTQLQTYLAQYPSLYPEASVSGYFGKATERAVQKFQAARGIVSSGTPKTTGYGAVGSRTRSALLSCASITGLDAGQKNASSTPATNTGASSTPAMAQTPAVTIATSTPSLVGTTVTTFASGATTSITYGEGKTPAINTLKLEQPLVLVTGDKTLIIWNTTDSARCDVQQFSPSINNYSTLMESVGPTGQMIVTVTDDPTTFSLRCDAVTDSTSTPTMIRRDIQAKVTYPKPSCEIKLDADAYTYGSTGKISWTSVGTDNVEFYQLSGDYVQVPIGLLRPSGFAFVSMVAGASQKIQLNAKGRGGTSSCEKTFTINPIPSLY